MGEQRKGRLYDAEGSRTAILNAAEEEFAHNGFDGARIDAIATAAGYNKSLLFHYYRDKLGLYAAVIQRIESHVNTVRTQVLSMIADDFSNVNAQMFKNLLATVVRTVFNFLQAEPNLQRIIAWEAAEEWKTFKAIIVLFDTHDIDRIKALLYKTHDMHILRHDVDPVTLIPFVFSTCLSYPTFLPLYQQLLKEQDLPSSEATNHIREQLVSIVLHGVLADPSAAIHVLGNGREV